MLKIPVTNEGLSEDVAIQFWTLIRKNWDILRSLQGNKKAGILRYVVTDPGKPQIGIPPTTELVDGLADLDVYVTQVSVRQVQSSHGKYDLSDLLFVFWHEVLMTDQILYLDKAYSVIKIQHYDPDVGEAQVVARMI
jgi:hypothetical protein